VRDAARLALLPPRIGLLGKRCWNVHHLIITRPGTSCPQAIGQAKIGFGGDSITSRILTVFLTAYKLPSASTPWALIDSNRAYARTAPENETTRMRHNSTPFSTLECSPKMRHEEIRHFSTNGEGHEKKDSKGSQSGDEKAVRKAPGGTTRGGAGANELGREHKRASRGIGGAPATLYYWRTRASEQAGANAPGQSEYDPRKEQIRQLEAKVVQLEGELGTPWKYVFSEMPYAESRGHARAKTGVSRQRLCRNPGRVAGARRTEYGTDA
jgi:hypothetical protein